MRLATIPVALIVAGCAGAPGAPAPLSPDVVAVIPGPDGHVGSVAVRSGGGEQVLDKAYAARRLRADGSVESTRLTPEEVARDFGTTLEALPGRPASFMLYFLEGKDELTPESKIELEKVFGELKRRPLPDIMVIGHTDTVGSLDYNDKLSRARADRLRDMLVGLGIPAERIQAAGRGKRELLVPTEDNVSEPRNRRVEINVR